MQSLGRSLPRIAQVIAVTCFAVMSGSLDSRAKAQIPAVPFSHVVVDSSPPDRPYYKMLGDINTDGQLDIVVAGADGPLVWYAYPDWGKSELADGDWDGVRGAIVDLDRDGHADIVMGGVVWFRNPGDQGGAWELRRIDHQRAHDVEIADLDGDGRFDVIARDQSAFGSSGDVIHLYRQNNDATWIKRAISCPHGEGVTVADLDRDDDIDVIIGSRWYENTGDWEYWAEHVFTTAWTEPDVKVEAVDVDGDDRLDIVLTPAELRGDRYKIAWYAAPDDARQGDWQEHVIVPSIETVIHALAVADFDENGHTDIAIAQMHQGEDPDEVALFLNQGFGATWQKQLLSTKGSHDLVAGDIDADGDIDLVGANHAGESPLELWRNELNPNR